MAQGLQRAISVVVRLYWLVGIALLILLVGLLFHTIRLEGWSHVTLGFGAIIIALICLTRFINDVRVGNYSTNFVALIAIAVAIATEHFWLAVFISLALAIERSISEYTLASAKQQIPVSQIRLPRTVRLLKGKKQVDTPVTQLRSGDAFVIFSQDMVPVDAVIIEGYGTFDESRISGNAHGVDRTVGEPVISGSILHEGQVTVKATQTPQHSHLQREYRLLQSAVTNRTQTGRQADFLGFGISLTTIVIAATVWAASGQVDRFLGIAAVLSTGAFAVAPGITLIRGIYRLGSLGVISRTASSLETLGRAKTIMLNKIGTLTDDHLVLSGIQAIDGFTEDTVMSYAGALTVSSRHPVARAVARSAAEHKAKLSRAKHIHESPGFGLSGSIGGHKIYVGRLHVLEKQGVSKPQGWKGARNQETCVYVAVDKQLAGVITFSAPIRPESSTTISQLRQSGVSTVALVTGDAKESALSIAKKVGITEVYGNATPSEKLQIIENASARPVAFVGDGVLDAPVLTAADIGIAFGAKYESAAFDSADIIIMEPEIERVALSRLLARQTFKRIRTNLYIFGVLTLLAITIFATGVVPPDYAPLVAVCLDTIALLLALFG